LGEFFAEKTFQMILYVNTHQYNQNLRNYNHPMGIKPKYNTTADKQQDVENLLRLPLRR